MKTILKTEWNGQTFNLKLADDLDRDLPIIVLPDSKKTIASFVMLGDVELNIKCARLLVDEIKSKGLLNEFDMLVAIEAKGIALAQECAHILGQPYYVVIRKTMKKYMVDPIMVPVKSITSFGEQSLVLNGMDAERMKGKRICIVEDVIATGGSIRAACELIEKAGAKVTLIATVLLKGEFEDPRLLYYLRPPM
jgi:adenine phosphoribosyltransferase